MLKVMIVEDELPILGLMERVIQENKHLSIIGGYTNPAEALDHFLSKKPDVVFLDIEMPKMNGLDLAEKMLKVNENIQIVFTTAYQQYALDAFKVHAVDYLLKPITPEAINRITNRLIKTHNLLMGKPENADENERVSIYCFGTFEVRTTSGSVIKWPTKKTEELLAYFLMNSNQTISKWKLVDLFWSDMDESRAIHNLHNTIYLLKKALKENGILILIEKLNDGYLLKKDQEVFFDVEELRNYAQKYLEVTIENVKESERIFSLYKGILFGVKDSFWCLNFREELLGHYTRLTRNLVTYYIKIRSIHQAEQKLMKYLIIYPLHEEMNLILLKLYATYYDDFNRLQKHYNQYEKLLNEELDVSTPLEAQQVLRKYIQK
ncbi:response regulator [Chengkuizengella axinellae]|uniref:Response regulator n=1 Tax=Chengkuizengella axinellae TaxID=3064388 RepID=A0ABT9J124_9BACL|nr:response regulator [Chengkuizengella sp. 2205SS18-9]MDP5275270.1 response regulator [Chengkuizengella sp. 2205SS18-9]